MQLLDIVTKNSTDRSVTIRICDSTDGTPETGVEHNTAGINLWYRREGAAKVSITEAALTALTDAHSDGGIEHIGDGYYRLDLPDAAFATGANYVDIGGTVTDMIVFGGRVRLVDYSLEDSVRMGLSALPNAAAGAAGGLPTDSAGKTSFNDIAATAIVSGGAITTSGGAVSSVTTVTGNVGGNVVGSVASVTGGINTGAGTITTLDALDTAQDTQHSTTQSAISGLNDPTAAAIADAVWDEATSGHATAGTTGKALTDVLADTNELQTNQGNWLTATGFSTHSAADVWSVATRVLTAATNITSDGSAITMSSAGVVGTVNLVNTTTTNTDMRGTDSAYTGTPPSVADIADGVWDELLSGHSTAGTAGKALSDAGSAGDPWSTALPGAYGAGTAGYLVGTYVDAAISDTATAASVAALNDLSTADIDARLAAYDAPTNAEMVAAFTEIKGATWSSATDTLEAIRDRGDSAWITATGFSTLDAAGVRTAVGLSAANLDTQLADIPTVAEFNARTLAAADYFDPAADTVASVTTVGTVNALAANAVNATALATDAVAEIQSGLATSAAISALNDLSAADVATALATYDGPTKAELDAGLAALNDLSATQVATAVWNAATADYGTAGTYGELLETNLDAAVSTAGGDSAATIWSYATRVLTAATNISGPVADAVWDEATSGHATAGTTGKALTDVLADTGELQANQGNWLTATGFSTHSAADVWSVATRVLTAATNITSDGSAITMSSSGVVGTVNLVNTTTTNTDMVSAAPSAASIADAVWDEATSGHTTAGTTGKALTDAGSAGDPWSAALPGAYGAGTAGFLVGTYIDAAISDTATAASVAALNDLSTADIDARLAAYGIPTVAELNARTLAAADYFDPATDTVASVTTVGTVNALAANSITSTVLATDCITSGKIATDAIGASELSAAAINAIQSGLATAANQATIIANQATIADYIDTEVGSIKAVTDKLDTTLVQDGAVYDFTAAALAAAPSGGGGGGDATEANQTTIIAHLTDIKGATWDSSNSLEAVSDAVAALDVGSGSGPKAVTITVTDGTDPLDTAQVSVYLSGVLKATGSTDDSGQFVANVASSGTFDVVATFDGHYQASAVTFNAATDSTAAVALTALSITPAPSGYTTGWLYSYDENGDVEASISYRYRPVSPNAAATGESLSPDWNTVTSDVNGKVEFPKMRLGVTYEYQRVGNERQVGKFKVPTTAGATTPLPQII